MSDPFTSAERYSTDRNAELFETAGGGQDLMSFDGDGDGDGDSDGVRDEGIQGDGNRDDSDQPVDDPLDPVDEVFYE